jgi:glycine oxidase
VPKPYDVIVIGGGIIGLALTWELSRRSARVLLIERREPGQEASHAGGGMIADLDPVLPAELLELAHRSARLYPKFASELADESQHPIDLRDVGVIAFEQHPIAESDGVRAITADEALSLEPKLTIPPDPAYAMRERAVDPRDLVAALLSALHRRGVEIIAGETVQKILVEHDHASGVVTNRASYAAPLVVNCAGAWASQIAGANLPTLPVKGHMVALAFPEELAMSPTTREERRVLRHVLRSRWCYIIPRSNGRYVVGSTVEPAGFDKSLNTYRVKRLQDAAARLIPEFAEAKIAEAWTGLRPGTPDNLPMLGATHTSGYFAATGHYRDGILLAPVTAEVMCSLLLDGQTPVSLDRFSPRRFQ